MPTSHTRVMHYVITAHVPDLRIGEQSESQVSHQPVGVWSENKNRENLHQRKFPAIRCSTERSLIYQKCTHSKCSSPSEVKVSFLCGGMYPNTCRLIVNCFCLHHCSTRLLPCKTSLPEYDGRAGELGDKA